SGPCSATTRRPSDRTTMPSGTFGSDSRARTCPDASRCSSADAASDAQSDPSGAVARSSALLMPASTVSELNERGAGHVASDARALGDGGGVPVATGGAVGVDGVPDAEHAASDMDASAPTIATTTTVRVLAVRLPRQPYAKCRPAARGVLDADGAVVRAHHRRGDAEPEPAAAPVAALPSVGLHEPFEDERPLLVGNAGSMIDHRNHGAPVVRVQRHLDRTRRRRVHQR